MSVSEFQVVERPAQATLSMRTTIPVENLKEFLGKAYRSVAQYAGELGVQIAGMPFAAYYNMDMQALDVEAGFPVAQAAPARGDIAPGEIPACRGATCTHRGPYETMVETYGAVSQWMQANNLQPAGTVYEFYLNGPDEVPPEGLETQIVFPLK